MHVRMKQTWGIAAVAVAQKQAKAMSEKFGVAYVVSQSHFDPKKDKELHVYVSSFAGRPPMFDMCTTIYTYENGVLAATPDGKSPTNSVVPANKIARCAVEEKVYSTEAAELQNARNRAAMLSIEHGWAWVFGTRPNFHRRFAVRVAYGVAECAHPAYYKHDDDTHMYAAFHDGREAAIPTRTNRDGTKE